MGGFYLGRADMVKPPSPHDVWDRFSTGNVYVTSAQLRAGIHGYRQLKDQMVGNLWPIILDGRIQQMTAELHERGEPVDEYDVSGS